MFQPTLVVTGPSPSQEDNGPRASDTYRWTIPPAIIPHISQRLEQVPFGTVFKVVWLVVVFQERKGNTRRYETVALEATTRIYFYSVRARGHTARIPQKYTLRS